VTCARRRAGADGAYVSTDIDHIGGRQQDHEQTQSAQAVPVLDVARQSLAGDVADPAAGLLHADDQRQHPEGGPQLPVPELGTSLGVGRDARRVVVGGPGHQARAEYSEQMTQLVALPASALSACSVRMLPGWRR